MSDEFDPTVYEEFPAPRVGAVARHAGETLLAHVGLLVCMGLAVGGVALMADALVSSDGIAGLAGLAMLIFVARPLRWGFYYMCLRAVRDDDPRAADTLRPFDSYADVVVANFLVAAMVILGLCLLVVPGVILYLRTRFVPYLVVEDRLNPISAIRESFDLTQGLAGTLLGITGLGWLAVAIGCIPLGLGIVPALIWWDLTVASLYHGAILREGDLLEGDAPLTDPSIA